MVKRQGYPTVKAYFSDGLWGLMDDWINAVCLS